MKEINFTFYGKRKTIKVGREIAQKFIGIAFILISAGLLGIFELVKIGWDPSLLKNTDFWISYFIKLSMLYIAFFGAYIFRKSQNLKNPKILISKEILKSTKILISNNFKTDDCEKWLENVFNYERKLNIFKNHLIDENSKITLIEPKEEQSRHFVKIKKLIYKIKLKNYNKMKKKREFIEKQLTLIEKHNEVINLYRKREYMQARELYATFEKEDTFKFFMPKFKKLNFKKLFNVNIETNSSGDDVFDYREAKVLSEKIIKTIAIGCIGLAIVSSTVLDFQKNISVENIIYMAMNLCMVIWYVFQGILTADRFVFVIVAGADADKIKICNKYRDDCILIGEDWIGAMTNEKIEEESENEKEGN